MDAASHQFLASAAFTLDQNDGVARSRGSDEITQFFYGTAVSDERISDIEIFLQQRVVRLQNGDFIRVSEGAGRVRRDEAEYFEVSFVKYSVRIKRIRVDRPGP